MIQGMRARVGAKTHSNPRSYDGYGDPGPRPGAIGGIYDSRNVDGGDGHDAQQLNVDTIANNLANVNTNAFKRSRAEFGDLLYQIQRLPGTNASNVGVFPVGVQVGGGVRPITVAKEWMQGNMRQTSNDLDLAIDGAGFFR